MAFTMIYNGVERFYADSGIKGEDYVRLLKGDSVVFEATGVSDFSVFEVTEGAWETPAAKTLETVVVGATHNATAGTITLAVPSAVRIESGLTVNFTTPCDCTAVTSGLVIGDTTYTVVDAMGNVMTGGEGVWATGAQISVVLNVEDQKAYIQNPAVVIPESSGGAQIFGKTYYGGANEGTKSDPVLVDFNFAPLMVIVVQEGSCNPFLLVKNTNNYKSVGDFYYRMPGNYIEIYSTDGTKLNESNQKYFFMAIG